MQIIPIPAENAQDVLPLVREWLEKASVLSSGRFEPGHILDFIKSGQWGLWLIWDEEAKQPKAVVVTEILTFPSGLKAANIVFCIGQGRKEWVHLLGELEAWAEQQGCSLFQMWARKGWVRDFKDYKLTHVLLEKVL